MPATEEELELLRRALETEEQKLKQLGKEADAANQDRHPPQLPIDHADDGGII